MFTLIEAIIGALLVKLGLDRDEPIAAATMVPCTSPDEYSAAAGSADAYRSPVEPQARIFARQCPTGGAIRRSRGRFCRADRRRDGIAGRIGDTLFPATSLGSALAEDFSATSGWLVRWRWTHPTIAFLASIFLIWILVRAAQRTTDWDNRGLSALVCVLLAAQYVLGVLDVVLLAPVWLQIAHLLGADVLWAALVVLTARLTLQPADSTRSLQPVARSL